MDRTKKGEGRVGPGAEKGWDGALAGLPHGKEFRFLDRVTSMEPGKSGTGEWVVRGDEEFFRGHFPGNPVVPGVLMVEAVAQLAGVVFSEGAGSEEAGRLLLAAVRGAKISGTVGPGVTLEVRVRITGQLGGLVQAEGTVSVEGRELMRGEVVLAGG